MYGGAQYPHGPPLARNPRPPRPHRVQNRVQTALDRAKHQATTGIFAIDQLCDRQIRKGLDRITGRAVLFDTDSDRQNGMIRNLIYLFYIKICAIRNNASLLRMLRFVVGS
jgi:hypothetical protein